MSVGESEVRKTLVAVLERYAEANRLARAAHDPDLCGLDQPGPRAACPGCRSGHYSHEAGLAAEEFVALSMELGDLLLCLVRHAVKRQPDALRALLMDLLAPDIGLLVGKILEQRNGHGSQLGRTGRQGGNGYHKGPGSRP